jgi:hypothetical protein
VGRRPLWERKLPPERTSRIWVLSPALTFTVAPMQKGFGPGFLSLKTTQWFGVCERFSRRVGASSMVREHDVEVPFVVEVNRYPTARLLTWARRPRRPRRPEPPSVVQQELVSLPEPLVELGVLVDLRIEVAVRDEHVEAPVEVGVEPIGR